MFICAPAVLLYRCIVAVCSQCFKQRDAKVYDFHKTLSGLKHESGGWHRDKRYDSVPVRDSFYIFLMQKMDNDIDEKHLTAFLDKMTRAMTNDGQVPFGFEQNWFSDETPVYTYDNAHVVDANMFFIIMTWWLQDLNPDKAHTLYLYCLRAWQWLDIHVANDALHESVGASWEHSRQHNGTLLLSNVQYIHTIRCMELLHIVERDERKAKRFKQQHERAMSTWVPEIYKTQETLPRILAVYFNIVPKTFIKSFNQEIQSAWIPCRVTGPVAVQPTYRAWVYGYADKHDTLVWPWVGFLWMLVLYERREHDLCKAWWTSYMDFHEPDNLYDVYNPKTGLPVRRAFLKGHAQHALTIAAWTAAKQTQLEDLI